MFEILVTKLKNEDKKTKIIAINIIGSFAIKSVSVITNFLSVPLLLIYLTTAEYGVWLAISSFFGWFVVFDLGTGNGLRNKLVETLAVEDFYKARIYVSTAYFVLSVIFFAIFTIFCIIGYYINWVSIFNAPSNLESQMFIAILFLFGSLCSQFILKLIATILIAYQKSAWADVLNTIIQVLLLIFTWKITYIQSNQRLLVVAILHTIVPILTLLFTSFILFNNKLGHLKPSIRHIKLSYFKNISNLGFKFFLIQASGIILYATDNYLILKLINADAVTKYSIVCKYFGVIPVIWALFLVPFWSATTHAMMKNDYEWIKKTVIKLLYVWAIIFLLSALALCFSNRVYSMWVGNSIQISFELSFIMFVYTIIAAWGALFGNFLNGTGKLKVQLYSAIFGAFINIPLSIFFCKVCNLGIESIPLATLVSLTIGAILSTIQYYKIINLKAKGIWNE